MTDCALTGSSKVPRCFTAGLQERYRCSRDPSGNLTLYDMLKSGQARPSSGCTERTPGILLDEHAWRLDARRQSKSSARSAATGRQSAGARRRGRTGSSLCSKTDVAGRTLPACHAPLACYPLKSGALVGAGLGYCTDTPNDMDQVRYNCLRLC